MNDTHPTADTLTLFAYGELDPAEDQAVTTHLAACAPCRAALGAIERARVAADEAFASPPRRTLRWALLGGLAAAAVVALVLLRPEPRAPTLSLAVPRYLVPELAPIDSMLTRLEQEKLYAIP